MQRQGMKRWGQQGKGLDTLPPCRRWWKCWKPNQGRGGPRQQPEQEQQRQVQQHSKPTMPVPYRQKEDTMNSYLIIIPVWAVQPMTLIITLKLTIMANFPRTTTPTTSLKPKPKIKPEFGNHPQDLPKAQQRETHHVLTPRLGIPIPTTSPPHRQQTGFPPLPPPPHPPLPMTSLHWAHGSGSGEKQRLGIRNGRLVRSNVGGGVGVDGGKGVNGVDEEKGRAENTADTCQGGV